MDVTVSIYLRNVSVDELLAKLDLIRQNTDVEIIMATLQDLQQRVAQNSSVIESAKLLLQGLKTRLDEAIAAGSDPVMLQALSDELTASNQALADAVVANTPAA